MIRRGFIYRAARVYRDPKAIRFVLVMTSDARNLDPRSPTVVGVPITTSLKGGVFRVRLKRGTGGLPEVSEVACEQIVQVPKRNFLADELGHLRSVGGRVDDALLDAVVSGVLRVISA